MTRHCLLLLLSLGACADRSTDAELLPSVPATLAPVGDPAGPAFRNAAAILNPFHLDAGARAEGERLYREMNCAYCHGGTGRGGMGPSLIDGEWLFGDTPADRFMSVHGGRARGMPAYGGLLADESIWKLVTHLDELRTRAGGEPGRPGGEPAERTRAAQSPRGHRR